MMNNIIESYVIANYYTSAEVGDSGLTTLPVDRRGGRSRTLDILTCNESSSLLHSFAQMIASAETKKYVYHMFASC